MKKTCKVSCVILALIFGLSLFCRCVPYLPESGVACPCKEGWRCCAEVTGEDLCVLENKSCPCAGASGELIAGEMTLSSTTIPANGQLEVEIVIWVFEALCEHRPPVEEVEVVIQSSRNQGDAQLDILEQPVLPTDADGRAVAFLGSTSPGESVLKIYSDGAELCSRWEDAVCVETLSSTVVFSP